jgi:hypothetical protein
MLIIIAAYLTIISCLSYFSYIGYQIMHPEKPPAPKEFIFPPFKPRVPENYDCYHLEIKTGNWNAEFDTELIINVLSSF